MNVSSLLMSTDFNSIECAVQEHSNSTITCAFPCAVCYIKIQIETTTTTTTIKKQIVWFCHVFSIRRPNPNNWLNGFVFNSCDFKWIFAVQRKSVQSITFRIIHSKRPIDQNQILRSYRKLSAPKSHTIYIYMCIWNALNTYNWYKLKYSWLNQWLTILKV